MYFIFMGKRCVSQDEVVGHICFFGSLSVLVLLLEDAHSLMDILPEPWNMRYLHLKELARLQRFVVDSEKMSSA